MPFCLRTLPIAAPKIARAPAEDDAMAGDKRLMSRMETSARQAREYCDEALA